MRVVVTLLGASVWVIAQAAPGGDPSALLTQLGIGAIVAAPFVWLWRDERSARRAADAALLAEVQRSRDREVELLTAERDESVRVLVDAVHVLDDVQTALGATVEKAADKRGDLDTLARRLELLAGDLRQQRDEHRGGQER